MTHINIVLVLGTVSVAVMLANVLVHSRPNTVKTFCAPIPGCETENKVRLID